MYKIVIYIINIQIVEQIQCLTFEKKKKKKPLHK